MSTFRTPVGPQPSRVYWRRRLVLALRPLAPIVLVLLILVKPGSANTGAPAPATSNSTSGAPTSASTNPSGAVECDLSKVTVEATTDAASYEVGVNPVLSFTLKSLMTEPCELAVGTDVQEFKVT